VGQRKALRARSTKMRKSPALAFAALLTGCSVTSPHRNDPGRAASAPAAVVAAPLEPAAQFNGGKANYVDGALVGAAGGAGVGAMSGYSSAGLLCTIGGPLCLAIVVPVAVVGGVVGGVAGAAVDALTTDPLGRTADARGVIEQVLADMRLTEALAAKASEQLAVPVVDGEELPAQTLLEVGVSELEILAREKDMALLLRARTRLYRGSDGQVLEERVAQTQTDYRRYRDWAADNAQSLRRAVDEAIAKLGRALVSARPEAAAMRRPRADT
jgi:hypothetical protein